MIDTREGFTTAVDTLVAAAEAYYHSSVEVLSDNQYDDLLGQLETASAVHPEWVTDQSRRLFGAVAAGTGGGGDVTHRTPMLSLAKIVAFDDAVSHFPPHIRVVVEPKLDGLAVNVTYRDGRLVQVATRGDGVTGENITDRVLISGVSRIAGLPATIGSKELFDVRGEVFMTDTDFMIANRNRTGNGYSPFVNPRNAAAGALRREENTYETPLSFAAYEADGTTVNSSYSARMRTLSTEGFTTAATLTPLPDNVVEAIETLRDTRDTLGFPIDGCVIKIDDNETRQQWGVTARAPRWAFAHKFEVATATTIVHDIELSIGRTGQLGIRARVEPVFVGGTTVTYASLHNVRWVLDHDIRVGDSVTVKRANDVIPRIENPNVLSRANSSIPWTPPTGCPQCGEPFDQSTELWRCVSPECSLVGALIYAASRDCFDIEGLSSAIATALVETGQCDTLADLFTLTVHNLSALPLGVTTTGNIRTLGVANATKIVAHIEAAKTQPCHRVITALGIRKTGRTMGRRLATQFGTMTALRNATVTDLCRVEGIAEGKAVTICEGLAAQAHVIDALTACGVNMGDEPVEVGGVLVGKTIVVTGKLSGSLAGLSRNEVNELIERHGGKASGSVSVDIPPPSRKGIPS